MIYGLILTGHQTIGSKSQHDKIVTFAHAKNIPLKDFIYFDDNPNLDKFQSGDTIICYAWNCLCSTQTFLRKFIKYIIDNKINLYSTTSEHYINSPNRQFINAFNIYEDIRFNFISNKNVLGAIHRTENGNAPGRPLGAKNIKHALDGMESTVLKMYHNGVSMSAIAKQMKVSAPTIKRFLITQPLNQKAI